MDMESLVIGLDVGGTKMTGGLATLEGSLLRKIRRQTARDAGAEAGVRLIKEITSELLGEASGQGGTVVRIGVGFGGPVEYERGLVLLSHHVAGWENVPLREMLEAEFGLPTALDNDANAGALGELLFGAGRGYRDIVYVNIGTGIGGGIISGGRLIRGARNVAGEIGHITIVRDGTLCTCGRRGCLEACASGDAIGRRATELVAAGQITTFTTLLPTRPIRSEEVFAAAAQGDELAQRVLEEVVEHLAHGLGVAISFLNPQVVIVGGGLSEVDENLLLKPLRERLPRYAIPQSLVGLEVVYAQLGYDAGVMGAIALAITEQMQVQGGRCDD